jgi:hypothetical protein
MPKHTPMMPFYGEFAHLYSAIANDRDFRGQVDATGILSADPGATFVELFAGPAYHCRALRDAGWPGRVVAVDSSESMRAIALTGRDDLEYVVADVVDALRTIRGVDVVSAFRYSIGLIDRDHLDALMAALTESLAAHGQAFVELHREDAIRSNFATFPIRERVAAAGWGTVRCTWPSSARPITPDGRTVEMDVVLTVESADGVTRHQFTSHEHLYTFDEVAAAAAAAGLVARRLRHAAFPDSDLALLERPAPTGSGQGGGRSADEVLRAVEGRAFSAVFDLRDGGAAERQIRRSGLRVREHDVPLSIYVYNQA